RPSASPSRSTSAAKPACPASTPPATSPRPSCPRSPSHHRRARWRVSSPSSRWWLESTDSIPGRSIRRPETRAVADRKDRRVFRLRMWHGLPSRSQLRGLCGDQGICTRPWRGPARRTPPAWCGCYHSLPRAHRDGLRCGSRRSHNGLAAPPHHEASSSRRERYRGALKRKGDGGRGPGEQDGRLLEPPDASVNAKSNDEKNHGAVEVRLPMVFDAPESGLDRYAQSGLELAHRDIL